MRTERRKQQEQKAQSRRRETLRESLEAKNFLALQRTERWIYRQHFSKQHFLRSGIRDLLMAAILDEMPTGSTDRKEWTYREVCRMRALLNEGHESESTRLALGFRDAMTLRREYSPRIEGVVLEILRDAGTPIDGISEDIAFSIQARKCGIAIRHWIACKDYLRTGAAMMSLGELHGSNLGVVTPATFADALGFTELAIRVLEFSKSDRRARILLYQAWAYKTRLIGFEGQDPRTAEKHFGRVQRLADEIGHPRLPMEARQVEVGLHTRLGRKSQSRSGKWKYIDRAEKGLNDIDEQYLTLPKLSGYSKLGIWVRQTEIFKEQGRNIEDSPILAELIRQWQVSPSTHRRRSWQQWTKQYVEPLRTPFIGIPGTFLYEEFEDWLD